MTIDSVVRGGAPLSPAPRTCAAGTREQHQTKPRRETKPCNLAGKPNLATSQGAGVSLPVTLRVGRAGGWKRGCNLSAPRDTLSQIRHPIPSFSGAAHPVGMPPATSDTLADWGLHSPPFASATLRLHSTSPPPNPRHDTKYSPPHRTRTGPSCTSTSTESIHNHRTSARETL